MFSGNTIADLFDTTGWSSAQRTLGFRNRVCVGGGPFCIGGMCFGPVRLAPSVRPKPPSVPPAFLAPSLCLPPHTCTLVSVLNSVRPSHRPPHSPALLLPLGYGASPPRLPVSPLCLSPRQPPPSARLCCFEGTSASGPSGPSSRSVWIAPVTPTPGPFQGQSQIICLLATGGHAFFSLQASLSALTANVGNGDTWAHQAACPSSPGSSSCFFRLQNPQDTPTHPWYVRPSHEASARLAALPCPAGTSSHLWWPASYVAHDPPLECTCMRGGSDPKDLLRKDTCAVNAHLVGAPSPPGLVLHSARDPDKGSTRSKVARKTPRALA